MRLTENLNLFNTNDAIDVLDSRLLLLSGNGGGVFFDAIDDLDSGRFKDGVSTVSIYGILGTITKDSACNSVLRRIMPIHNKCWFFTNKKNKALHKHFKSLQVKFKSVTQKT